MNEPAESVQVSGGVSGETNDTIFDNEDEFAFQLRQEAEEKLKNVSTTEQQTGVSGTTYTDPTDGTVYEWDFDKRAWLPKVNEDFLALYYAGYGANPLDTTALEKEVEASTSSILEQQRDPKEVAKERKREKRKAAEQNKGWFEMDQQHNTSVYVSGLPLDYTQKDFEELMTKCGIIAKDPENGKLKIKLYTDPEGNIKGDGRCCYIKRESVDLALKIIDDYELKPGKKVHVEQAQFALKGDFDPKKRKKVSLKTKKKLKDRQEKLLDWRPEKLRGERPKSDVTVILKNFFTLSELTANAALIFELQDLLTGECAKYGVVQKVVIYENNPAGIASVTFKEPENADDCITMMDYRLLRNRQLRAERWDGRTKYKVEETEEQRNQRIQRYEEELEKGD